MHPLALPNILTYGRIVAIPIVVGCMFWQNILHGGLWLRWFALAIFIAAGVSDFLDGIWPACGASNRHSAACWTPSPTNFSFPLAC